MHLVLNCGSYLALCNYVNLENEIGITENAELHYFFDGFHDEAINNPDCWLAIAS